MMNDAMETVVSPLHLRRRSSQKAFSRSLSKRQYSSASRSKSLPRARVHRQPEMEQFTPPLTPSSSSESLTPSGTAVSPQFYDYVRALYPYHPPYDRNSDTVTLPLNPGDIFLVHSIHPSGWADATLLDSGIRGWLPTNYCEAYSPGHMRNLLNALTQLYEIIPSCDVSALCNLGYTRPMVAGVRYLLDSTKCLGRNAHLIAVQTGVTGLRRYRKGMLGELSTFLRDAEDTVHALKGDFTQAELEGCCTQLMNDACRTVLRAAKFLDIWTEESSQRSALTIDVSAAGNLTPKPSYMVPPTPPAESSDFDCAVNDTDTSPGSTDFSKTPTQPQISLAPAIVTSSDVRSPDPSQPPRQFPTRGASLAQPIRPLSVQNVQRASYRISMITCGNDAGLANSAVKKLSKTYERLNENLISFGAISPGVSTPNDVLLATGETLQAGRHMLKVVDAVCKHSPQHFALEHAREQMYRQLHDLVLVAKQVFDENSPIPVDMRMSPASLQTVSDCVARCVQTACECSSASQRILGRIGDFELEEEATTTKPVCHSETSRETPPPAAPDLQAPVETEQADHDLSDLHEPLDVSKFPMPASGAPTLPPLNTGLTSLDEITASLSASTIATPDSQHSPSTPADILTPATPLSSQTPCFGEFKLVREESVATISSVTTTIMSTPTSQNTSTRNSSQSVTTIESSANTSPETDLGCALTPCDSVDEIEKALQATTFAHELYVGKDGQIYGGSLPALVERLTDGNSTPDALFVKAFFFTFRIFTTPQELADALIARFDHSQSDDQAALAVRLRVYNATKQWLELYWAAGTDDAALDMLESFAEDRLTMVLPEMGRRLREATGLARNPETPDVSRQNSVASQQQASIVPALFQFPPLTAIPPPAMSKQDHVLLNAWKNGGANPKITDFTALELARQLTLMASELFCAIKPEEFVGREWTKETGSRAPNIKAMAAIANDLVSFIEESILVVSEPKKRAKVIKHWIKAGVHCVELNNLFVALQIQAALTNSTINRLHKSWDQVAAKHKMALDSIQEIFDRGFNHRNYRRRLEESAGPAVPFLGTHQTDLYHIDQHDRNIRPSINVEADDYFSPPIINFEKHLKTSRIIVDMQRFQVAYRLEEVMDLRAWLHSQLTKAHCEDSAAFLKLQEDHYNRSLALEPRFIEPRDRADSQATTSTIAATK